MGAGQKVTVDLGGPVKIQVEEGALDALIAQGGAIRADGGLVYLSAKAAGDLAAAAINHTGITEAKTLVSGERGEIYLMGDMARGQVNVAGTLDASAPAGMRGGFVETSAAKVTVAEGAQVKAGHWLIDPNDFTIANSGGDITATALSTALGAGNVTIQTTATTPSCTGVSCGAGTSGNGDIFVRDDVTWTSGNTLTLSAYRNIEILATLDASGGTGGKVALEYGQGAAAAGNTATYSFGLTGSGFTGKINLKAGNNFSTKLGSDGAVVNYTVITSLGAEGSTTGADLQGMDGNLSGNYALGADIDATATSGWNSGAGFAPIGTWFARFTGRFDGLGHTIGSLTINRRTQDAVGLFAFTQNAMLSNVGMVGGSVSGRDTVGGLVGYNEGGTISNSYATGTISGGDTVGGLVGYNEGGTISNSYATGSVSGTGWYIGGLAGYNDGGTVSNSYATGNVNGDDFVGGLVGYNYANATVTSSYAMGPVTGTGSDVGGLVGTNDGSTVSNSYATGAVSSSSSLVGGLVGTNENGATVSNSYATGTVSGLNAVGGLVGINDSGATVSNSYATGAVNGTGNDVGGLVGSNYATISNSYATGNVSGSFSVGGLVGYNDGDIANSYATGNVNGSGDYVGGLVGYNFGDISSSYASGTVSGSNDVGGLVGVNDFGATVSTSYAAGAVTGTNEVGGLVGGNYATISNSYATGAVTGTSEVGGLVGRNDDTITNSYATGAVTGTGSDVGGLVGLFESGTVSNSFWDTTTSGQSSSGAGTGLPTAQMKSLATYTAASWDIDDAGGTGKVWRIYDGDSYPLLRSFLAPLAIDAATAGGKVYDGVAVNALPAGLFTIGSAHDASKILFGGTLPGQKDVGSYVARIYSNQTGYDLIGTRGVNYDITPSGGSGGTGGTGGMGDSSGNASSAAIAHAQGLAGEAARAVSPLAGVTIRVAGTGIRLPEGYLLAIEEEAGR
jgi:hypothetical protein